MDLAAILCPSPAIMTSVDIDIWRDAGQQHQLDLAAVWGPPTRATISCFDLDYRLHDTNRRAHRDALWLLSSICRRIHCSTSRSTQPTARVPSFTAGGNDASLINLWIWDLDKPVRRQTSTIRSIVVYWDCMGCLLDPNGLWRLPGCVRIGLRQT